MSFNFSLGLNIDTFFSSCHPVILSFFPSLLEPRRNFLGLSSPGYLVLQNCLIINIDLFSFNCIEMSQRGIKSSTKRGHYMCSHCGQPKTGHTCPYRWIQLDYDPATGPIVGRESKVVQAPEIGVENIFQVAAPPHGSVMELTRSEMGTRDSYEVFR